MLVFSAWGDSLSDNSMTTIGVDPAWKGTNPSKYGAKGHQYRYSTKFLVVMCILGIWYCDAVIVCSFESVILNVYSIRLGGNQAPKLTNKNIYRPVVN